MMNQMYGPGQRVNRGGRGHYQQNRFHQNRFPHPHCKNPNYNQMNSKNNNNNNQKCYNQNLDHCPNPNMETGEYLSLGDRFANPGGNPTYLGNEPASYQMDPMYHGQGAPVVFEAPAYGQPHYAELGMPAQMVPQMQLVNYPPPPQYMPPRLVYSVFPQPGMPQPQPEQFNVMKSGTTRTLSRESFGNETDLVVTSDYALPQTSSCVNCVGNEAQSAATIHELQTELSTLQTKNQALLEENTSLKVELQTVLSKNEAPAVSIEIKTGLSVNAEPFVAKPTAVSEDCMAGLGQKWPPDPVDQGFEKTCTELIEIIKDKSEETWVPPVELPVITTAIAPVIATVIPPVVAPVDPFVDPIVLLPEIPVVSANGSTKWSEMVDSETAANPEAARDYNSRGRVPQDQTRQHGPHEQPHGRGPGSYGNPAVRSSDPGLNDSATGRGAVRKTDTRRNQGQQQVHNRGLNSSHPPDRTGGFQQTRSAMGNRSNRGFRGDPRPYQSSNTNWRSDCELSVLPARVDQKLDDNDTCEAKADRLGARNSAAVEEGQVEEKCTLNERRMDKREESFERSKGGSGDGPRSQAALPNDPRPALDQCFIKEIDGDLFTVDPSFSLAHCVAVDLQMGSGIAVTFRDVFKRVDELLDQHKKVGQVAILEDKGRFIYYLVTKVRSQGKPTIASLTESLWEMANHCHANKVKNLAMPRIGCGLDRLHWGEVKSVLERVFSRSGVQITVYNYQQVDERRDETTPRKKSSLFIVQNAMNLAAIQRGTGLIYLCAEDDSISPTMKSLDQKFNLLPSFRASKRVCGDIVETVKGNDVLYGLVVKKGVKDRLSYAHLLTCLKKLRTKNNIAMFEYFGLEAFRDNGDELTMTKISTIIRNIFGGSKYKVEFWLCFPEEFVGDMDIQAPSSLSSSSS